jgi:hypothetical protein
MAMTDQVRHQESHRALVLHADLIELRREQAVDEHAGNLVVEDVFQRFSVRIGGRRENDPVDPPLMQRAQHPEFVFRIVLRVGKKHHQAKPGALGLDGADDVAEIGV